MSVRADYVHGVTQRRRQPTEDDDATASWIAAELPLDDERRFIRDADPAPHDDYPVFIRH